MNRFYIIFLGVILFFGNNIIINFGLSSKYVNAIYLVISLILIAINRDIVLYKNKWLKILLLYLAVFSAYQIFIVGGEGSLTIPLLLCCSPFVFSCFPSYSGSCKRLQESLFNVLIIFFIVECSIALLERILWINFFPWHMDDFGIVEAEIFDNAKEFRSCSLLGQSLQNALVVSTIMTFILVSNMRNEYKYSLWTLGYMSILCFNTRTSIVGNVLILVFYSFCQTLKSGRLKLSLLLKVLPAFGVIALLVFNFGLGGRLLDMGLVDDSSAQTRIDTWNIFYFFDIKEFLYGLSQDKVRIVLLQSRLKVTENFWIDFLLRLGLVFIVIWTFLYVKVVLQLYKGYKRLPAFITASTFLLLASTNNSLSATWIPLFIFLFSIYIFKIYNHEQKKSVIKRKILYMSLKNRIIDKYDNLISSNITKQKERT